MALSDGGIGILLSCQLNPADISKIQSQINSLQNSINKKPINIFGSSSQTNDSKKILDAYGNVLSDVSKKTKDLGKTSEEVGKKVKGNINDLTDANKHLSQSASDVILKFAKWYIVAGVVTTIIGKLTGVVDTVKNLNDSLVDLQMATGENVTYAQNLLVTYNQLAKELGVSTISVAESANDFLRQGKTVSETNTLIKDSLVLSKVGMLGSAEATKLLTSVMKGYKVSVEDAISIVDKLSAVDVKAAVDAGGLATAMSYTANMASMMGVSMDKLIGYMATVGEVTQASMESVGNSFKTIFARMSNVKLGKFLDDEGENISNVEQILHSLNIELRSTPTNWRNFGDVLDEVGTKWDTYDTVQKSAIANAFAGVRQQEKFVTLMNNYSSALDYAGVAAESSGSALKKFEAYENSVEAATNRVTASYEAFSSALLSPETYKSTLNFFSGFLDTLTDIIKALGAVPTLITAISGVVTAFSQKANLLAPLNITKVAGTEGLTVSSLFNRNLASDKAALVLYNKALEAGKTAQEAFTISMKDASTEAKTFVMNAKDGAVNVNAFGTSLNTASIGAKAAAVGMKLLSAAINVGIMLAVSLAIQAIVSVVDNLVNAQQKAREAAIEAANAFDQETQSINDYKSKVIELRNALDGGNLSQEETIAKRKELLGIQDEVVKKYGYEIGSVDLLTSSLDNLSIAFDNLSKSAARDYLSQNRQAIQEAFDYFNKIQTLNVSGGGFFSRDIFVKLDDFAKSAGGIAEFFSNEKQTNFNLNFTGTIDENIESLTKFEDELSEYYDYISNLNDGQLKELGIYKDDIKRLNDFLNNTSNQLKNIGKDSDLYKENLEVYNTAIQSKVTDGYLSYYKSILDAQAEFNDAMAKGDEEGIKKATEGVQTALTAALAAVSNDPQYAQGLQEFFNSMVEAQSYAISKFDFKKALESDSSTQNLVGSLSTLTSDTPLNEWTSEQVTAFNLLTNIFASCGGKAEDLMRTLVDLGIVQSSAVLPSEEQAKSLDELTDATNEVIDSVDVLNSALKEQQDTHDLSSETIMNLIDAGYASAIAFDEETGKAYLNKDAMIALAKAKIDVQIADLLLKKNNLQSKLIADGNAAIDSAKGFVVLAGAKALANDATYMELEAVKASIAALEKLKLNIGKIKSSSGGGGGGGSSSAKKESDYLKGLKALLDARNDALDMEIDKQKDVLAALREQYEVEDMITKLQQTQLELTNAQNERNVRLYNPETGKFEWVADPRAVREAQKAYDDAQREYSRYQSEKAIEDQIDALTSQRDAISTVLDAINNVIQRGIGLQIKTWDQLIAKLKELGIAYQDISAIVPSITGGGSGGTADNAKASAISKTLKKGSKGSDVKTLQRALNALGYRDGKIDGVFGSNTQKALKAFQKAMGITASGILDAATKSKFSIKGYDKGGLVDYTGLANVHGSRIDPEWMYSAPDVKSIMSSVPSLLANMANGGGGDKFYIQEINVSAKNLGDLVQQMKNVAVLGTRVPAK